MKRGVDFRNICWFTIPREFFFPEHADDHLSSGEFVCSIAQKYRPLKDQLNREASGGLDTVKPEEHDAQVGRRE